MFGDWFMGISYAMLLLATLMGPMFIRTFFSLSPLRFIGLISYSIYVWHYPILQDISKTIVHDHTDTGYVRLLVIGGLVILAFSVASYYLIEKPFIAYRRAAHSSVEVDLARASIGDAHTRFISGLDTLPIPAIPAPPMRR